MKKINAGMLRTPYFMAMLGLLSTSTLATFNLPLYWEVSYDGPEDWDAKQVAYYGSPERAALDPDPAQYIAKTERWFVDSVLPVQ